MKPGQRERAARLHFTGDAGLIQRTLRAQSYLRSLRVALVSLLDRSLYRSQRSGIHVVPPMTTSSTSSRVSPSLRGGRIDDSQDPRDAIGRKAAEFRMSPDQRFVLRVIHAVDPVIGDVAVHPLHAGTEARENPAGLLRNAFELCRAELASTGNIALDHELRHGCLLEKMKSASTVRPAWRTARASS